ncbi:hypothetical protein [Candidatus Uabimicrobium amorphum]|uniref:Uncharacterized protein n=1 Tax=Uabimicrobium amorphum TaxID=2596890 RepID=A0A5S9F585_UABAM|nr:hypothetical protein [Candidatus Uabimicrobium amorphum]BBM86342.1 hypothetical protein UABAM_04728 [Candidatus Uabimicrobium amorphum]
MTRNGVTKHPKEWKWSSYNQHTNGKGPVVIDFHDIYLSLGDTVKEKRKRYAAMMEERMLEKGLLSKQPHFPYGLILGTESFIKEIITKYTSHKFYKNRKSYFLDSQTACLRKPNT